jgi:DNA-binding transcriptional ArsR family regulator/uncharacterized protein YndB with AHSA1/START domain
MTDQGFDIVWKALSDPTRRGVLDLLRDRSRTTSELTDAFPSLSRYAVMKHLGILVDAGLVLVRREGRKRWNHLNAVPLQQVHERWVSRFAGLSASGLLGLKDTIENLTGGDAMSAETLESAGTSVQIEQEITIAAPRSKVFDALINRMDEWWAFRVAGEGTTVTLDARPGGQFLETRGDDGHGEYWGTVQAIRENELLRIEGPMGTTTPMIGVHSYKLEDADGGTLVKLSHRGFGELIPEWRDNYSHGWQYLIGVCLNGLVVDGKPYSEQEPMG